jgi:hypothetical protein
MLEFMDEPWFGKLVVHYTVLMVLLLLVGGAGSVDFVMQTGVYMLMLYFIAGSVFLAREFVLFWTRAPT